MRGDKHLGSEEVLLDGFNHGAILTKDTDRLHAFLSVFFRDPDGLECELCVTNPDERPGVVNPPGTPAQRYATAS